MRPRRLSVLARTSATGSRVNAARFVKSVVYQPTAQGIAVTDAGIVAAITTQLQSGALPIDPNGIYTVIFRGDFLYSGWLSTWCGYHSHFTFKSGGSVQVRTRPLPFTRIILH
jgi:hypothetical protein